MAGLLLSETLDHHVAEFQLLNSILFSGLGLRASVVENSFLFGFKHF